MSKLQSDAIQVAAPFVGAKGERMIAFGSVPQVLEVRHVAAGIAIERITLESGVPVEFDIDDENATRAISALFQGAVEIFERAEAASVACTREMERDFAEMAVTAG